MNKKILIFGSAGFLMSNFIRYLLYRTKEYNIVSIDANYDKIYKHKKHKYYFGNLKDSGFVNGVIDIEKPDVIVNSVMNNKASSDWTGALEIFNYLENLVTIPVIQLVPTRHTDYYGAWECLKNGSGFSKSFLNFNNTILEIPETFGIRQKWGISHLVTKLLTDRKVDVYDYSQPWVHAEDLASLIWFLIETKLTGYIKMPELDNKSEKDIALIAGKILDKKPEITIREPWDDLIIDYKSDDIKGWVPDSTSIEDALTKTVNWYNVNRWALTKRF